MPPSFDDICQCFTHAFNQRDFPHRIPKLLVMERKYRKVSNPQQIQQVRNERFKVMDWPPDEKLIRDRPKHVKDFFRTHPTPFRLLADVKLRRSLFGVFLHSLNRNVVQDYFLNENKLCMLDYDMKTFNDNELKRFHADNDFIVDMRGLLEKAVREEEVIDYGFLYANVYALQFCDTPLATLDNYLAKFRNLKVLILCANCLTEVRGKHLPRTLEYLELFANQIEYVHTLARKVPKCLVHVGLRRNWLTNESRLHLLGDRRRFSYLQSLDLSENDIYDLRDVLYALKQLESLMCLQLQGNPCSVVTTYKDDVLRNLPWLQFLDNCEILSQDRVIGDEQEEPLNAMITFTCHRIMGLPRPKKEKGQEQYFYFAISMPLLEEVMESKNDSGTSLHLVESPSSTVRPPTRESCSKDDKEALANSSTKTKATAKNVAHPEVSPYDAPDEYATECKSGKVDTTFQTERFVWDKIMQLPEEALLIESPERNSVDIRDTFRSRVRVKLIYLAVQVPQSAKKGKGSKAKKSVENVEDLEPMETVVKKITLASFTCDLHSINWSDKTLDYIWADQTKFQGMAVEVEGSLRPLEYSDKVKNATGSKRSKAKQENGSGEIGANDYCQKIPKTFTIQLGFGLHRDYSVDHEKTST